MADQIELKLALAIRDFLASLDQADGKARSTFGAMRSAAQAVDFDPQSADARELADEVQRIGAKFREAGAAGESDFFDPLDQLADELQAEFAELRGRMDRLADAQDRNAAATKRWDAALVKVRNALAGLGLGLFLKQSVETELAFERIERRLKFFAGSAEGARAEMAFLREETERLGAPLQQTAEDYSKLAAALKGKLPADEIRTLLSGILEMNTALGLTPQQTNRAINALQQMASKGTVSAEELRQQFGENVPGAISIFAEALGVGEQELNKMLERGEVLAVDALPKLGAQLRKTFGPEAQANIDSAQANLNRFGNILDTVRTNVASGFLDHLNEGLKTASANSKELADGARVVGAAFGLVLGGGVRLVQFLTGALGTALGQSVALFGRLQISVLNLAETFAEVLPGYQQTAEAIRDYRRSIEDAVNASEAFAQNSREDGIAGVQGLVDSWNQFTDAVKGGAEAQREASAEVAATTPALQDEADAADAAAEAVSNLETSSRTAAIAQRDLRTETREQVTALDELAAAYEKAQNAQQDQGSSGAREQAREQQDAVKQAAELQEELGELQGKTALTADEANRLTEVQGLLAAALTEVRNAGQDVGQVFTQIGDSAEDGGEQVAFFGAGTREAADIVDEFAGVIDTAAGAQEYFADVNFDGAGAMDAQTISGDKLQANLAGLEKTTQDNIAAGLLGIDTHRSARSAQDDYSEAVERGDDALTKQADSASELAQRIKEIEERMKSLEAATGKGFADSLERSLDTAEKLIPVFRELKECVGGMEDSL